MKIVRPETIVDATLTSSNVTETITAYSAATVYLAAQTARQDSDHHVYESLSGVSLGTATMTIAVPGVVTRVAHGLTAATPICFTTTGALPTGVVSGTIYYVIATGLTADAFQFAATVGGTGITTSGSQSGTHTLYSNPNVGKALTNTTFWLDTGPTNKWAMFDAVNGTVTTGVPTIAVTLDPTTRIDSLALLSMDATSVVVTMTDATDGLVYDETFDLISTNGIDEWWSYFFEEVVRATDLVITDLPPYVSPTITVTVSNGASNATVGTLITGLSRTLGGTLYGGGPGILDYSRKDTDVFGNYTLVERGFSRTGSYNIRIARAVVDEFVRLLSLYRATPVLYVMTDDYGSTAVFGFYRSFSVSIDYYDYSLGSLELEGLT